MYVGRDFDPSDTPEAEPYCFDFVKDLPKGDTITGAEWYIKVAETSEAVDDTPLDRLDGDPIWQGTKVFQNIKDLQPGVTYHLQAVAITNNGNRISLWSHVEATVAGAVA